MSQPPYGQPPQGNYPPPQGNYPPPQGNYPPQQGGYPPPQGNYPPQQGGYPPPGNYPPPGQYPPTGYGAPPPPIKKKRGLGIGGIIGIIVLVLVVGGGILYATGILSNVDAPDYPGATKATLTDAGTTQINKLYDKGKSSGSDRKVFLTPDTPDKVLSFYKTELEKSGWKQTETAAGAARYEKDSKALIVFSDLNDGEFIKEAKDKTYIIIITGSKN